MHTYVNKKERKKEQKKKMRMFKVVPIMT